MSTDGQPRTIAYGDGPEQVADLVLPSGPAPDAGWPTVVLVHGGFWRDQYRRDLMTELAADLATHGFATWNLEYRRVGPTGGGFPGTLLDVAAGTDHLVVVAEAVPLDLGRIAVVGHSAGGHLALWLASRGRLPAGAAGADDPLRPCAAVGQAPVASLRRRVAARRRRGGRLRRRRSGRGRRSATPSPIRSSWSATVCPCCSCTAEADETVPVDQSERYEAAASAAGDPVELVTGAGDHFTVIDPDDPLWDAQVAFLERHC